MLACLHVQSMSPGLKRARQPFLVKNAVTGVILGAFTVGVYAYSMQAVKQEEFEDLDDKAKQMGYVRENQKKEESDLRVLSKDEEMKVMQSALDNVVNRKPWCVFSLLFVGYLLTQSPDYYTQFI